MYNRYIPQPDGSYHRSSIRETPPQKPPAPPPPCPESPKPAAADCPVCPKRSPPHPRPQNRSVSPGAFWKQLLPRDLDTSDLLVVILLLLMSADSCDDGNWAMLTLAIYLFL